MSIAGVIIGALIAVGGAIIEGAISNNAQSDAQRETRDLYNQQRRAEQRQLNISNRQARKKLSMNQQNLDFEKSILSDQMQQKEQEKQDTIKQAKQESFISGLSALDEKKEQSLLFKQNAMARWSGNA